MRRLILIAVAGALMSVVLFAQPTTAQQTTSDPFVIQGTITSITDELHFSVLVEEAPSDPMNSGVADKGRFNVTEQTEILRRQGDELVAATKQDLSVGQFVEATYAGPVGASYPSVGEAERIVILEEAESEPNNEQQPQCFLPEGCFLSGDSSSEKIVGGTGPDYIAGGGGDDALHGLGGGDWLDGGAGDDLVRGNDANDLVDGGSDNDLVIGGDGNDYISGFTGNDILEAGPGSDFIYAADGEFDRVTGGPQYDICIVNSGDDVRGCEEVHVR